MAKTEKEIKTKKPTWPQVRNRAVALLDIAYRLIELENYQGLAELVFMQAGFAFERAGDLFASNDEKRLFAYSNALNAYKKSGKHGAPDAKRVEGKLNNV